MVKKKRQSISETAVQNMSGDVDTLFHHEPSSTQNPATTENKTSGDVVGKDTSDSRLVKIDAIKKFFKKPQNTKQYSVYLPEALQKRIKKQAIIEERSLSDVMTDLFMEHYLSNEEIKEAYNEYYDQKHKLKRKR